MKKGIYIPINVITRINELPRGKKKFADLIYILNKCRYHLENIGKTENALHSQFDKQLKNFFKDILHQKVPNFEKDNSVQHRLEFDGSVRTVSQCYFEYDSFIESTMRCIEFFLKICLVLLGYRKENDKFSKEKFFTSLTGERLRDWKKIRARMEVKDPELLEYFSQNWKGWIGKLNKKRGDAIHKYIGNDFKVKAIAEWNALNKDYLAPNRYEVNGLKIGEKTFGEYSCDIFEKLVDFEEWVLKYILDKNN